MILNRAWFFTPTINHERFLSQDEPTEQTFRNFLESVTFKLEATDTASEIQQGLVETATQAEFNAGIDNNSNGFALYVRPSHIKNALDALDTLLQDQIDTINAGIATINATLVTMQTDISNLQTDVTNIQNTVTDSMPLGSMIQYPTATPPNSKWLICEGQSVPTATYPDLFAIIGYNFGGAGANFNLPDLRSKFVAGYNASGAVEYTVIGSGGGSDSVTLTGAQSGVPAHTHPLSGAGSASGTTGASNADIGINTATDNSADPADDVRVRIRADNNLTLDDTRQIVQNPHTHSFTGALSGNTDANTAAPAAAAHENRPAFVVFPWMIKVLN